jgi:methionyl-tRNA synthetase
MSTLFFIFVSHYQRTKMEDHYFTVGQLLDYIEKHNISRDGKIYMQRIEDFYYEPGRGWIENAVVKNQDHPCGDAECTYTQCFSPVLYDNENLYLDAHY